MEDAHALLTKVHEARNRWDSLDSSAMPPPGGKP
jgi:hypothetical protein